MSAKVSGKSTLTCELTARVTSGATIWQLDKMGGNRADAGREGGYARASSWHYGPCDYGRQRVGIGVSQNSVSKVRERLTATFQIEKFALALNLAAANWRRTWRRHRIKSSSWRRRLHRPPGGPLAFYGNDVAIFKPLKAELEDRQGRRTDLGLRDNCPEVEPFRHGNASPRWDFRFRRTASVQVSRDLGFPFRYNFWTATVQTLQVWKRPCWLGLSLRVQAPGGKTASIIAKSANFIAHQSEETAISNARRLKRPATQRCRRTPNPEGGELCGFANVSPAEGLLQPGSAPRQTKTDAFPSPAVLFLSAASVWPHLGRFDTLR